MPIVALSLAEEKVHESRYDPDKGTEKATRFTYGPLDSRVAGWIKDKATSYTVVPGRADTDEMETSYASNERNFRACEFGLRAIENFVDGKGNPVQPKRAKRTVGGRTYEVMSEDTVRLIPEAVLAELAEKITAGNELSEAQQGNS